MIFDKLSRPRPQTQPNLGNRGRRSRRGQSPERGYLTHINGKTNKTYRRNAGTYRQMALTYRHKLKKSYGYFKKNAYLCSRKRNKTITKTRRPTGYQGQQDYDNIHHNVHPRRQNQRTNRKAHHPCRHRQGNSLRKHERKQQPLGARRRICTRIFQHRRNGAIPIKTKAGAQAPAKRRKRNNNLKTTEK